MRRATVFSAIVVLSCVLGLPHTAQADTRLAASIPDSAVCKLVADAQERRLRLPRALLSTIALVESGRRLGNGRLVAWPWTINVAGAGHYYDTAEDAIAAVQAFQAAGIRSIDVGCMQINLLHHPTAFPSLQQAFDPQFNASYAASFLKLLFSETSDWLKATANYHSRTPEFSDDYGRRVMQAWPFAAEFVPASSLAAALGPSRSDPLMAYTAEFRQMAQMTKPAERVKPVSTRRPGLAPMRQPGRDWKTRLASLQD